MRDVIRFAIVIVLLFMAGVAVGADLKKGLAAYENGDYETAMAECLPLAEEGIAEAQFCVGQMYANGFGVMMDDAAAIKWYGLAATAGDSKAQYQLGVMHANGWGVDMNDAQAAEYYRQAAEKGHSCAQRSLAYVTSRGIGVDENLQDAYMWYYVSAELGDTASVAGRDEYAGMISEEERLAAEAMARQWLAKFKGG
ncbi:MAG: sel1 repeat family protein [Woeseiaceae bacterium]|nr:sel1 repeat family protein [Woeseiaceae bacterium]